MWNKTQGRPEECPEHGNAGGENQRRAGGAGDSAHQQGRPHIGLLPVRAPWLESS